MKISLIAAVALNNVIGKDNRLLWRLPADMKFFREKTTGHHILTGRKNYESIPLKYRPLSNRVNLIVTRNQEYEAAGTHIFTSIPKAISFAKEKGEEELFIIGGGDIYEQTIQLADILYVTKIDERFDGDAFFPVIDNGQWELIEEKQMESDSNNQYNMVFCKYIRKEGLQ